MDKQQQAKIKQNINSTRKGNQASRYGQKGLTSQSSKINSHGFQKMMSGRGVSKIDTKSTWDSFEKSKKSPAMVRHAKKGESYKITYGNNMASGNYVSQKSGGNTPSKRIDKLALPSSNSATHQANVKLARNQNVVYGKVAAQPGFQKADPNKMPRRGGATQTLTDGGFSNKAVDMSKNLKSPNYKQKSVNFSKSSDKSMITTKSMSHSKGHSR
jgi:hypothetical protein